MPNSKAKEQWMKANTVMVTMRLTKNTDADVIAWLDKQQSKQGAIREVLKKHIEEGK